MCFKLDTGAEVTVVGEKVLHSLDSKKQLQTPTKRLCGPDQTPLEVLGEIPVTLAYKNRSCKHPVFIVKNLQQNLLGLPAIKSLSLLTPIETVNTPIPEQYPSLFNGLGTFPECYEIKLKQDATVFSKVGTNCGFWQIPLAKHSRHYTTFVTPFGRYCFNKLPFSISSAP